MISKFVSSVMAALLASSVSFVPSDPTFRVTLFREDLPEGGSGQRLTLSYNQQAGKFEMQDENQNTTVVSPTLKSFAVVDIPQSSTLWSQASYAQGTIKGDPLQLWSYPQSNGVLLEIGAMQASGFYDQNLQTVPGFPADFWNDRVKQVRIPVECAQQTSGQRVFIPIVNR